MLTIEAVVKEGHKVASGQADDSPYPRGSIEIQAPYFKENGINLDNYYFATLNLSITPYIFQMVSPEFTVHNIHWAEGFAAEDFSFSKCELSFAGDLYDGLVYYPHPETKIGHFHNESLIEIITEYIPNIKYGDKVDLRINEAEINIKRK